MEEYVVDAVWITRCRREKNARVRWENPKEGDHLEELDVGDR
jgi:hypothetical protein